MSDVTRREILKALAAAAGLAPGAFAQQVHAAIQSLDQGEFYSPRFFTSSEYATLRALADLIIPADENSRGAIDAGAAEFIDYICSLSSDQGSYFRDGLRWIDDEMKRRSRATFTEAPRDEQTKLLDLIAFRRNSTEQTAVGVNFFSVLRGIVVDAYYTSPTGMAGIGYMGNQVLDSFTVPDEAVQYALRRSPFGVDVDS